MCQDERIKEACGVFGIYNPHGEDAASSIYYGLSSLQHRGQESCGIVVNDDGLFTTYKDTGLVNDVFTPDHLNQFGQGNIAIGHVRYGTTGGSARDNAQPIVVNHINGHIALAHNGNLTNSYELRSALELKGSIFHTTSDTEVISYIITEERLTAPSIEEAVNRAVNRIKGAYSLVVMSPTKMIAVRDEMGFRPLCIGKRDGAYILSSESCALDTVGAEFIRDVEPGEIVTITPEGISSDKSLMTGSHAKCIFEYIYFARPDSYIDGINVHSSRITAGRILAQTHPVDADIVVGVPESGNAAAMGFALESGIPYGTAFVKNSYVGRTFIKPKQSARESSVMVKLNVLREIVRGKRVVMVDDSIVRGTTSARIVKMLKDAGAKEVHVRISSPPFKYPCYFGTDVPSSDQLPAFSHTVEQIAEMIGADSLGYLDLNRLSELIDGDQGYCNACFSGDYPLDPPKEDIRGDYDK